MTIAVTMAADCALQRPTASRMARREKARAAVSGQRADDGDDDAASDMLGQSLSTSAREASYGGRAVACGEGGRAPFYQVDVDAERDAALGRRRVGAQRPLDERKRLVVFR